MAAVMAVLAASCTARSHAAGVDLAVLAPISTPDRSSYDPNGQKVVLMDGGRTGTRYDDATLYVEAGEPGSTRLVSRPGSATIGRRVRCTYHAVGGDTGGLEWDIAVPTRPEAGGLYVLRCVHPDDNSDLNGYPILIVFTPGSPLAGGAVGVDEIAKFAVDSETFESPTPVLSPPVRQIVGIDTWLAVSSRLVYTDVSAQAGNAWVTVRPIFRAAVWDFGDGESMRCSTDVDKVWDPASPTSNQSTQCSHLFERASVPPGRSGSVAVSWTIYETTNQHPSTWTIWGVVTLNSPAVFNVSELQSVIR